MICYRIRDWNSIYENSESRKIKRCSYVCTPNKHDGRGYQRMVRKGPAMAERLFAAWNGIIQLASRMPVRGVLADRDGPLTADDLAVRTGLREETYELAFAFFSSPPVGWLEEFDTNSDIQDAPGDTGRFQDKPGKSGVELNGTELNGTDLPSPSLPAPGIRAGACIGFFPAEREGEGGKENVDWTKKDKAELERLIAENPAYPFELVHRRAKPRRLKNPERFLKELPVVDQLGAAIKAEFRARARNAAKEFGHVPTMAEDYEFHILLPYVKTLDGFDGFMAETFGGQDEKR